MNDSILRAENLSKKYGRIEAVRGATFSLPRNKITAFLGENGAGKTTTLKLILGFLRPDSGRIDMGDCRIGYVSERPAFFDWLKGKDIITLTARRPGIQKQSLPQKIENLCQKILFDPNLLERNVQTYSLGNQKKFSYLQSLVISPDLLIVDEPFSSLDPPSIKSVRDLFGELKKEGRTVFLSSHLVSEVEKICDEFIIISKGDIIVQENLNRIKETFVLVHLEKSRVEKEKLKAFSSYLKEENSFFQLLVEKNLLHKLKAFLGESKEAVTIITLDLETIFLFFAR